MKLIPKLKQSILSIATAASLIFTLCGCSKDKKGISNFSDVKSAKIGVMTGTTGESIAANRFPQAKIKCFDDIMDAVAAIKSGQLDAIITGYPATILITKKNPDLSRLQEPLEVEDTAIAIRKGNEQLLEELNAIIKELKNNGTLESLKTRWFKTDLNPYEELDMQLPKDGTLLKIGVSATREPFSFVDKNGRVTGHDGELARIISARLHRPIEFLNMKFMALIPALQSGKVDLIITGMTATNERRKSIDFTQPYFANSQVMLVKTSQLSTKPSNTTIPNTKLTSTSDLKDKRLGVLLGSVHDTYALNNYPKATILQYKNPSDLLLAVKASKVDAGFYTRETLIEIFRSDTELGLLGDSIFSVPIGMGFRINDTSLREKFNTFLQHSKNNGTYSDMVDRWMKKGDINMPIITNTKQNGILIVGNVSDKGLPFTAIKNNKLIGFDIELAQRFAAYLGKEIKFSDMEFGNLIAALSTSKIDMIASTLMITEDRKKQISFSETYYELGTNVFALKKNLASTSVTTEKKPHAISFSQSVANSFHSNIIQENRYLLLINGLKTTVIISVLSAIFGTLLGALVCFMRMSKRTILSLPAKLYISIIRGTPVLVLLMLIFYVVFASVDISPLLVAVIAFGMNFAAYTAEIFRTGIEGIDKGQTEAGIAMGFTKLTTFINIVLPQTIRRILPIYKGEFISLVKMTSIVGYIAVQDLTKASDIIRSRTFDAFFPLIMVAILYFSISWLLMQSLEYLERITDPKFKKRKANLA